MAQPQVYNGYNYYQQPDGTWKRGEPVRQAPAQTSVTPEVVLPAPPPPPPAPPARTASGAATEGLKPGFMWVDPNNPAAGQVQIPTTPNPRSPQNRERDAQIKTILGTIQRIRTLAEKPRAVGSTAEFIQGTPLLNQNVINVQAAVDQLRGDIIQQQIKLLAEANQGGVTGLANQASEAERIAASIAPLRVGQSLPEFMAGLQNAEDYYLRQAASFEGKPAPDQDTLRNYLPKERLQELDAAPAQPEMALAQDGMTTVAIPPEMQQSITRYLVQNRDRFDPSQYAAFRNNLAQEYGFAPMDLQALVGQGREIQQFFRKGGRPEDVQATVRRPTTPTEQLVTDIAANPAGAAFMSFADSLTAGVPTYLAGRREEMEAVRQNQPLAALAGDVGGGIAGSLALGSGLANMGARGLVANPMVQNALFGTVSGATQSEDPLMGAAIGLAGSLGGDVLGRQIGKALPGAFAPSAMREARESVPSGGDLGNQADRLYREAAARGEVIQPAQTNKFLDDLEQFAAGQGFVTPRGEILGTGPVQDALKLAREFRDQPLTPQNAQTIRDKFAEGRMAMREGAPDPQARMFSGEVTSRFDDFAEAADALPGIAAARQVAQRRIMGREIDRATQMGQARGEINYTQGSEDLGIRRAFGALDTGEIRGSRMFPPEVSQAIERVSRGTPGRNVAQWLGRFSPQGGTGIFGSAGLGTMAGLGASDPLTGLAVGGTMAATGLFGRKLANQMTRNDAELASLVARGGPQFQALLRQAEEEAAIRASRIGAGALGATAITPFRD